MKLLFIKFFKRKSKAPGKAIEHGLNNNQGEEQPIQKTNLISDISFIYCLVGNIVEERFNKSEQKTFKGTKYFSPGTKVYCYPPKWGDGYEKIKVIGRHRKSKRMITIIMASKYISNWRLKTIYNPYIIKEMVNNGGWTGKEWDKENISSLAASLNAE